jgi:hydroxyacylglutathione hydrolase
MILETFAVGQLGCNCTIVADEATGDAIVVDGGDGVDDVVQRLEARGLRASLLVHTHAHIDHIADVGRLRELTGGRGLLHPGDLPLYHTLAVQAGWLGLPRAPKVVDLDGDLLDGDRFKAGSIEIEVLHTPGHTPGSVCFAVSNGATTTLLTGDTLFAGSIGRWDLGGTSMEDIIGSIHGKLMDYDDTTPVIPGHGPFTTIGVERNSNPYLALPSG